ncbi:MAG: hypothetical protein ACK561_25770, partial [Pseudomonadaceae bacterium]
SMCFTPSVASSKTLTAFLRLASAGAKPGVPAKLSGHAPALRLLGEAKQGDQHRLVPGHGPFLCVYVTVQVGCAVRTEAGGE